MSEVTTGSAAPAVIVDIEATVKAEVAKAVAAIKGEESKIVTAVKTYWPHVAAAFAGYGTATFGVIEKIAKLF